MRAVCQIRIERTKGQVWPTTEAYWLGSLRRLAGLFQPAIELRFDFATEFFHPWPTDSVVSPRQLVQRTDGCALCVDRNSSVDWHAHLFVVPWLEDRGSYPCGQMIDIGKGNSGRRAAAISTGAIKSCQTRLQVSWDAIVLRVLGHEIGHLFNLGHDCAPSLMSPLETLGRLGSGETNKLNFDLSDEQRCWLADAPESDVRPGFSRYHGRGGTATQTLSVRSAED
jgi:hypothetical protein